MSQRGNWDGEPDTLNPLRFLLLLAFVGGVVLLIWWGYATGHIKHVDSVPLPPTAPATAPTPRYSGGGAGQEFESKDRSA
jgi:hypothetical protein